MTDKPLPDITDFNRPYFEGCAEGELRIARCNSCGTHFHFFHYLCPECWSPDIGWERASGKGKISHFTIVHQAPYEAFAAEAPYMIILVQLDEGVRMMSNLIGCAPEDVRIGLPVRAIFEQRGPVSLPMFVLDDENDRL